MDGSSPSRVIVADDHPLMRQALRQAVELTLPDAEIAEAGGFDEVVAALGAAGGAADLMLLDLTMPGMAGFVGVVALRSLFPAVPLLVVSAAEDPVTIHRAVNYGAAGFIPKSAPIAHISAAIRAVLEGRIWLPPNLPPGEPPEAEGAGELGRRLASLTAQQLRVLVMLREGKANKQIAYELGVAEQTIKMHVSAILKKLGVSNRTQAVILAAKLEVAPALSDAAPGGSRD